ncbi:MAG: hypothetical protein AB2L14_10815 [Candidatus Xenobiia bacterium LiM19]
MDKKDLIESARELHQVEESAASEYGMKKEMMVAQINALLLSRPDIEELVGTVNIEMMKDNHANHARFVEAILRKHNPEVLVETVLWVFRAYRSRGFHINYWAAQLNAWISIIEENLSVESFSAIYPLYVWFQVSIPLFARFSEEHMAD